MKRGSRSHLKNKPISRSAPSNYSYWPTGPCSHMFSLLTAWAPPSGELLNNTHVSPSLRSGGSGDSPETSHSLQKHSDVAFRGRAWKGKRRDFLHICLPSMKPSVCAKIFENCWCRVAMSRWSWVGFLLWAVASLPHIRVMPRTYSFISFTVSYNALHCYFLPSLAILTIETQKVGRQDTRRPGRSKLPPTTSKLQ